MLQDFEQYLKNKYYSQNTVKTYLANFKKFLVDMHIINVEQLNNEIFFAYRADLQNKKLKGQTINTKFEAIRSFLKFLYNSKNIVAPACEVKQARLRIRLPEIKIRIYDRFYKKELSINEIKRVLRTINKDPNKFYRLRNTILIQLLASTGLRISEALQINIDAAITGRVEVVGKRNKIRTVLIPATVVKVCREFRKHRKELYLKNQKLFIDLQDNVIKSQTCGKMLKKYGVSAKVKLQKLFLHNLRHFYTIDCINQGMDLNTIAQNLGIEDMEVLKIYQSRNLKHLQEQTNKKGRRLLV
ncbi:tyrosine-type recombinase/integrase [Leptotrichia sp. OH3620_COT-345]|uniref:tyrosine-type recombinase/integrase n=1 Tax=Leptotrichia sp. OH3620_COT-345 TaxID=2491048 RepID=UPI001F204462|nr:tyrosine-type recombinase/integrase [Leptotrichia sp. OH3620_COT-345]